MEGPTRMDQQFGEHRTMSNTTDDQNGGSTLWTILKVIFAIIAVILAIRLIFWIIGGAISLIFSLLPLLIVIGVGYFLYRLFKGDSGDELPAAEPKLLEHEKDPLEDRFRELEAEEARVNAMLKDQGLDQE